MEGSRSSTSGRRARTSTGSQRIAFGRRRSRSWARSTSPRFLTPISSTSRSTTTSFRSRLAPRGAGQRDPRPASLTEQAGVVRRFLSNYGRHLLFSTGIASSWTDSPSQNCSNLIELFRSPRRRVLCAYEACEPFRTAQPVTQATRSDTAWDYGRM